MAAAAPATLITKKSPAMPAPVGPCAQAARWRRRPRRARCGWDTLVGRHLGGDVEIHVVAGIVAVDVEDALTALPALGGRRITVGAGRGEDVARHGAIGQVFADEAGEQRLVAAATAEEHAHAPGRQCRLDDGARRLEQPDVATVGRGQPLECLGHHVGRVIEDLLRPSHRRLPCVPYPNPSPAQAPYAVPGRGRDAAPVRATPATPRRHPQGPAPGARRGREAPPSAGAGLTARRCGRR